jgi:hypothetical protein
MDLRFTGYTYITGTTTVTGSFAAIQAIGTAPAVLAAGTAASDYDGAALTGMSIPSGETIPGRFTAVQLTSGACIAYKY